MNRQIKVDQSKLLGFKLQKGEANEPALQTMKADSKGGFRPGIRTVKLGAKIGSKPSNRI